MQKLENGIEVPTNSDEYNLTPDLAQMGRTTNTIVDVVSLLAANALTKRPGLAVRRLDLHGTPVHVWDAVGSRWTGPGTLDIKALSFTGTAFKDIATTYHPASAYADGGRVYLQGAITNANTTTIPADTTVKIGQITDTNLYPAGVTRQRLSIQSSTSPIATVDGYINIGPDGVIGIMINPARGLTSIGQLTINLDSIGWAKK